MLEKPSAFPFAGGCISAMPVKVRVKVRVKVNVKVIFALRCCGFGQKFLTLQVKSNFVGSLTRKYEKVQRI